MGRLLLVVVTVAGLPSAATAQQNQPLSIGDVVRIERHTDRPMTGRVLSLGAGTMELRTQSSIQTVP